MRYGLDRKKDLEGLVDFSSTISKIKKSPSLYTGSQAKGTEDLHG